MHVIMSRTKSTFQSLPRFPFTSVTLITTRGLKNSRFTDKKLFKTSISVYNNSVKNLNQMAKMWIQKCLPLKHILDRTNHLRVLFLALAKCIKNWHYHFVDKDNEPTNPSIQTRLINKHRHRGITKNKNMVEPSITLQKYFWENWKLYLFVPCSSMYGSLDRMHHTTEAALRCHFYDIVCRTIIKNYDYKQTNKIQTLCNQQFSFNNVKN